MGVLRLDKRAFGLKGKGRGGTRRWDSVAEAEGFGERSTQRARTGPGNECSVARRFSLLCGAPAAFTEPEHRARPYRTSGVPTRVEWGQKRAGEGSAVARTSQAMHLPASGKESRRAK